MPVTRRRYLAHSVSLIVLLPTLAEMAGDGRAPSFATELDGRPKK